MDTLKKLVSVKINIFVVVFLSRFWTLKISLLPQKTAKNGKTSESWENIKEKTFPVTLPTTTKFFPLKKSFKN